MSEAASVKRCSNCGGSDFFLEEASGKLRCKNCKSYYEDFVYESDNENGLEPGSGSGENSKLDLDFGDLSAFPD